MSETLPDYQRFRAPSRRVTVALFGHWRWQLDDGTGGSSPSQSPSPSAFNLLLLGAVYVS